MQSYLWGREQDIPGAEVGATRAFGYQCKGWVGILVSVVMRVQAESRGLGDEIAL